MLGGSGEIRTRDQRIKRSRDSSKPYINQWSKGPKLTVRLSVRLLFWYKVPIFKLNAKLFDSQNAVTPFKLKARIPLIG